jgi:hypothetical protein
MSNQKIVKRHFEKIIAAAAKDGATVFKMPDPKKVPDEAADFGGQLAASGIIFLPYFSTAFFAKANEFSILMLCTFHAGENGEKCGVGLNCFVADNDANIQNIVFALSSEPGRLGISPVIGIEHLFDTEFTGGIAGILYKWLGLLSSGMADISETYPPAAINKKREKNGRPPLIKHNVVTIKERHFSDETKFGRTGVRLHWRRGHVRRIASGGLVIVRPHLVGKRELGEIVHDGYDCRQMIQVLGEKATIH